MMQLCGKNITRPKVINYFRKNFYHRCCIGMHLRCSRFGENRETTLETSRGRLTNKHFENVSKVSQENTCDGVTL